MCGIMGYVGSEAAFRVVLGGLRRLEYRGYDSSGIATLDAGELHLVEVELVAEAAHPLHLRLRERLLGGGAECRPGVPVELHVGRGVAGRRRRPVLRCGSHPGIVP